MSAQQYRFPQGPMVDSRGYVTLEWQQWLQNPQFVTATAGSLKTNSVLSGQTNFINVCEDGEDGQDGYDGAPGRNGLNGSDGKNGINGQDAQDGEDGINGFNGKNGTDGKNGINGQDGIDGDDYSFNGIPSSLTLTSINFGANLLTNYTEGTWSPGIAFGGGTTGITYTSQVAAYTRIGNKVFFQGRVALSSKGSSTGTAVITGLPFTTANVTNQNSTFVYSLNNSTSAQYVPVGVILVNVATLSLFQQSAVGTTTVLTDTDFQNNTIISFSGHYQV